MTNLTEEKVGERIKRLRKEKSISQRELTKRMKGVSYGYLSRIESGEREPSLTAIREIAKELDVLPVYLETGALEYCPHCLRTFTPNERNTSA